MKKKTLLLACLCITGCLMLTGCNNNLAQEMAGQLNQKYESTEPVDPVNPDEPDEPDKPPVDPENPDQPEEPTEYVVTFKPQGGECLVTSITVKENEGIPDMPVPTKEGYTFDGWFDAPEGGNQITAGASVTENITLYAHWTEIPKTKYVVTFDPQGGECMVAYIEMEEGEELTTIPDATKNGYTFAGWYDSTNNPVYPGITITSNITLYAHWTEIETPPVTEPENNNHTIILDAGDGWCGTSSMNVTNENTYDLPSAEREGYSFKGWYTMPVGGNKITNNTNIQLAEDQTLYAHWSVNVYKIGYDLNGGSGNISEMSKRHNVTVFVSNIIPTKEEDDENRYIFKYWVNTQNGRVYETGDAFNENGNIILRAEWSRIKKQFDKDGKEINIPILPTYTYHTITFDTNGGRIVSGKPSVKQLEGKSINALPVVTRTGYKFTGWYIESTEITTQTKVTSSETAVARWEEMTNSDFKTLIDPSYLKTAFKEELQSLPSITAPNEYDLYNDSDSKIRQYVLESGIDKGWRGSAMFDPTFYARYVLNTYGFELASYRDAWTFYLGWGIKNLDQPTEICVHQGGSYNDEKRNITVNHFQAEGYYKQTGIEYICTCGQVFKTPDDYDMHTIEEMLKDPTTHHSVSPQPLLEFIVTTPAHTDYVYRTYCLNSGQVVEEYTDVHWEESSNTQSDSIASTDDDGIIIVQ